MSATVIVSLYFLLSVTTVFGTEDGNSPPCDCEEEIAEMRQELATVRAQMASMTSETERRVDELHSQLHYWLNVTVNILKDHYSSFQTNSGGECVTGEERTAVLESTVFNITHSNYDIKDFLNKMNTNINRHLNATNTGINEKLNAINNTINGRLDSLEISVEEIKLTAGQCCNDPTGSFPNPANNCSHILHDHPGSPSGHYWLQSSPGYAVNMFCDMERVCGCSVGQGWIRVADIDMTQPNKLCPAGFRKVTTSGKTLCGGQGSQCISTTFPSHGLQYSRVCGRITGYQFFTPDAFHPFIANNGRSIDNVFVDGIVLTHGTPKTHIWTFACGVSQYNNEHYSCPCNVGSSSYSPPFIGNDYFCDSGHRYNTIVPKTYLTNSPLWDGTGCVSGSCCTFNSPPWFCKTLPCPTTDNIELHLCTDQGLDDEDVLFEKVEVYIQ